MYISDLQYFPSVNYIFTLVKAKNIHFSGFGRYRKSSFLNKMEVPGSNGVVKMSIPIKGGRGIKVSYANTQIDPGSGWQEIHFRTISSIYGNAPFFPFYQNELRALYSADLTNLFTWNILCFDFFVKNAKMSNLIQFKVAEQEDDEIQPHLQHPILNNTQLPPYNQVFSDRIGFIPNMSCLDLLMNLGPDCSTYMHDCLNKLS
ncbi:MAG: WbqC family protein [Bacteroidota bacterium]